MRKPKPLEVGSLQIPAHVYPAHVRPLLTKQLKCQSLHCGSRRSRGCPAGGAHLLMRHRSAAALRTGRPKDAFSPSSSPILQQFCPTAPHPIKGAAAFHAVGGEVRPRPATIGSAQALVTCLLPRTKQNRKCLQNAHYLTFFEQLAFRAGANDIAVSVTTRERVGRTMVVRSIQERSR